MHTINPSKLHHSKWTTAQPSNKEKHFMVTQLLRDEEENVVEVVIEACVLSSRAHFAVAKLKR